MRRVGLLIATMCSLAGLTTPGDAQVAKLYPVDEAAAQPEFFTFRASLLRAVQARDTAALLAALAPDMCNSLGGEGGIPEFQAMWRPSDPDSRVWETLVSVLSLGGTFHGDTMFIAPYTFSRFPGGFDAFDHVAVVGADVRVRGAPSDTAPILTRVSFDILPIAREAGYPGDEEWVPVRLENGRPGYVHATYARSPIGYRAVFVRRGGVWRMRALVAGD